MTSSIGFYCGPKDQIRLDDYARSIGLRLVSPTLGVKADPDPANGPFCYMAAAHDSELHPYGKPPTRLSNARDPLLAYMRSYFRDPYLVAGHIQWSDDSPILAAVIKPHYSMLKNWVNQNFARLAPKGFYIGPDAETLVASGAEMVNVLPGSATFNLVKVG